MLAAIFRCFRDFLRGSQLLIEFSKYFVHTYFCAHAKLHFKSFRWQYSCTPQPYLRWSRGILRGARCIPSELFRQKIRCGRSSQSNYSNQWKFFFWIWVMFINLPPWRNWIQMAELEGARFPDSFPAWMLDIGADEVKNSCCLISGLTCVMAQ